MYAQPPRQRIGSGIAAAIMTALLGWAMLLGLAGGAIPAKVQEGLAVFRVAPPPPPPKRVVPKRIAGAKPSGRAAPRNLRSQAAPVAAPRPIVVMTVPPPPIVVAVKPFAGDQATQGAAPTPGPGTGAGGQGDGTGAGGWGNGDGDGPETPPRWRKGRLKDSDYPREAGASGIHGAVAIKFLVWTDGRVRDCRVTHSSGNRLLDDTTCRLVTERYRYDPSRDAAGRPVPAYIVEDHDWVIENDPVEPPQD
jgi:protein TonB